MQKADETNQTVNLSAEPLPERPGQPFQAGHPWDWRGLLHRLSVDTPLEKESGHFSNFITRGSVPSLATGAVLN